MISEQHVPNSGTERSATEELSALIRNNARALIAWAGLIVASLVAFGLTEATQYHQLAAGILMSSSTLFILMALFECLWRLSSDHQGSQSD